MWSNVIVKINSTTISDDMGLYPYKSIVASLLTKGKGEEESLQTAALYYRDVPTYDEFDVAKNTGFAQRVKLAANSKTWDMTGPLSVPIFTQGRYIPPGCAIEIKMIRSPSEFCLDSQLTTKTGVSGVPYVYSLEACDLIIHNITVHSDILKYHQMLFQKNHRAQYPVRQFDARVSQISIGTSTFLTENLFSGKLPTYTIFGLVESTCFNGSLNQSPMNFKPHGLSSITLKSEQDVQLYQTINVDFDSGNYQMAFQTLFDCLSDRATGNNITRESYTQGFTFYVFHLYPPAAASELLPEKRGNLKASQNY